MKIPYILYRKSVGQEGPDDEKEFQAASKYFQVKQYRSAIPENSTIIGRYSVLPYYKELEEELKNKGSSLINSFSQHNFIADITNYYEYVKEFTPKTHITWENLESGKWVVKGKTNSRKHQWNTHMFADGREQLMAVVRRLMDDTMIREQGLIVRDYVPLKKLGEGINGLPITCEWRCFFLEEQLVASDFYWASHPECYPGPLPAGGRKFAEMVSKIISKHANFFVLDIALTEESSWILVEINDGQMSGLSCIEPEIFYKNLYDNYREKS